MVSPRSRKAVVPNDPGANRIQLVIVVAGDDGEHVAIVYDSAMATKDGIQTNVASIEVFRVIDGKITEVWNCGYKQGVWN
jgi:predicted SnoaL-like aldol condensation-catalyzing enzyme